MTSPTPSEVRRADAVFTEWQRGNLTRAADHFGLTITGEPRLGWRLRSISAPAERDGESLWLRVVTEQHRWLPDPAWTGNQDANAITGIAKPRVLDSTEWDEHDRAIRAEVMTVAAGQPCAATEVLHAPLDLPDQWWRELRRNVEVIGSAPTSRVNITPETVRQQVDAMLGIDLRIERWETVHGDLHWANLRAPEFMLLDWELWGRGPAGTDAATLYLVSLPTPDTARKVHDTLADVLDSPDGARAQLYVITRFLKRAKLGDFADLADHLQRQATNLLS